MSNQFKIAIVIPTYNHLEYALRAAKTALANTPQSFVMVVDDASPSWDASLWNCLPQDRFLAHRFPKNDRNLTRSWNWGLLKARELKIPVTTVTNSDVMFPKLWSKATIEALEKNLVDLAGPVTNAPGHRPIQQITRLMTNYRLTDEQEYIDLLQEKLLNRYSNQVWPGHINGFCLTALTDTWWSGAYDEDHVFRPDFKMIRNEDELEGRWLSSGKKVGVVPGSFVLHYRGVSRNSIHGSQGKGWFRKD